MTKTELEQRIEELENEKLGLSAVIESQQQQIMQFQKTGDEVVQLRGQNADLQQMVADLQGQITQPIDQNRFMELGRGFIRTKIGKRVMAEPTISSSPFLLGVMGGDYEMIQDTYRFAIGRFMAMGQPPSEADLKEVQDLLVRTGFAAG